MILRVGGVVISGMLALAGMASRCDAQAAAEPEHYRTDDYRAPTPATLRGARVITTAQAQAIWRAGTGAFVDAMPDVPRPANLPAGTLWRGKQRLNIPGSTWLADTGYGELSAAVEDYLRSGLERHHRRRPCQAPGDLLPQGLLDVMERSQTRHFVGLFQRRLVSRRHRRLAGRRTSAQRGGSGATARPVDSIRAIAGSRARAQTTVARSGPAPRRHSRWFCCARRKCAYPTRRG